MASRKEIEDAIRIADKAGRKEDVLRLADALDALPDSNTPIGIAQSLPQGSTLSLGDELGAVANAGIDQFGQAIGVDLGQGDSGNETFGQAFDRRLGEDRTRMNQFADEEPILDFGGRFVGGIAPSLLTGAGTSIANTIGKEAFLGALEGFGASESDGDLGNILLDTAVGSAFSAVPAGVISSTTRGNTSTRRVVDEIKGAVARAEETAGKRLLTIGERTGSPVARGIENFSQQLPLAGRSTRAIKEGFQQTLKDETSRIRSPFDTSNSRIQSLEGDALLNLLGALKPTQLAGTTPSQAIKELDKTSISAIYDGLFKGKSFDLPDASIDNILDAIDSSNKVIGKSDVVGKAGKDLLEELSKMGNKISGSDYQRLRSDLGSVSRKLAKADDIAGSKAVDRMQKSLDEAVKEQLSDGQKDLLDSANSAFRTNKVLEKFKVVDAKTGEVNQKALARALEENPDVGRNPVTGEGFLNDLSTISKVAKAPKDPSFLGTGLALGTGFGTGGAGFAVPIALQGADYLRNTKLGGLLGDNLIPAIGSGVRATGIDELDLGSNDLINLGL